MSLTAVEMRCRGKDFYVSERIASVRAQQVSLKRGVPLYHYKCRYCKQWHLTHIPQKGHTMRNEPKIGTKAPMKTGGSGGGLSQPAVKLAMQSKAPASVKKSPSKPAISRVVDTKRNAKAMDEMK